MGGHGTTWGSRNVDLSESHTGEEKECRTTGFYDDDSHNDIII